MFFGQKAEIQNIPPYSSFLSYIDFTKDGDKVIIDGTPFTRKDAGNVWFCSSFAPDAYNYNR